MNACNRILGIPRVAPRVAATRGCTKSRVMATSYTEIVEILEVKNVYTYVLLENHVASCTNPPPCQRVTLNIPKKPAFF